MRQTRGMWILGQLPSDAFNICISWMNMCGRYVTLCALKPYEVSRKSSQKNVGINNQVGYCCYLYYRARVVGRTIKWAKSRIRNLKPRQNNPKSDLSRCQIMGQDKPKLRKMQSIQMKKFYKLLMNPNNRLKPLAARDIIFQPFQSSGALGRFHPKLWNDPAATSIFSFEMGSALS